MFYSTKTYTHAAGLSCAFRQWRANSHCRFLHGYALQIKFMFAADTLDNRNWVMDFGGLKSLKTWLEDLLDHKTLVAYDDPELGMFEELAKREIIRLMLVPATGCEALAHYIFVEANQWLIDNELFPRVWLRAVEVREHEGNSAIYEEAPPSPAEPPIESSPE